MARSVVQKWVVHIFDPKIPGPIRIHPKIAFCGLDHRLSHGLAMFGPFFLAISTFSDRPTLTLGQHRMATICQKAEDMACCRIVSGLYLFVFK